MNKLLSTLFAGLFVASISVGAFAADAAKPADAAATPAAAPAADAAKEKPAVPAKKAMHHKKAVKKDSKTEAPKADAPAAK